MSPQEFETLFAGLQQLQQEGFSGGAALATLLRTRGPVFRRAGARMLVYGDGRVVRGLSAGCPEADIVERTREVIAAGHARRLRYDREYGYDALLELGCGGEMEVLLEPLRGPGDLRFAEAIARCLQKRQQGVLMTVFAAEGRCLPRPRRLLCCGQPEFDELGDPRLLDALLSQIVSETATPATHVQEVITRSGSLQVLVERLQPVLALVLIGVNATALALARLARGLGWQVRLVDHREDTPAPELPSDVALLRAGPQSLVPRLAPDARTAVVVMTHNFERDLDYMRALQAQPLAYFGALGSRQRAARMHAAIGATATPLQAPAGLDIGSETPEEIALAIAAEIQATVSGRTGGRLSAGDGPIH